MKIPTGKVSGHAHDVELDANGDGTTSEADGHTHEVRAWEVLDAGGHSHPLNTVAAAQGGELSEHPNPTDRPPEPRGQPLLSTAAGRLRKV